MNRLEEKYRKEVVPSLMERHNYKTVMLVPKIEKIVVRVTAKSNSKEKQFAKIFSALSRSFWPIAIAARGEPPAPANMANAFISISIGTNSPTPVRAEAPTSGM